MIKNYHTIMICFLVILKVKNLTIIAAVLKIKLMFEEIKVMRRIRIRVDDSTFHLISVINFHNLNCCSISSVIINHCYLQMVKEMRIIKSAH